MYGPLFYNQSRISWSQKFQNYWDAHKTGVEWGAVLLLLRT